LTTRLTKRQIQAQNTKQILYKNAIQLFKKRGYNNVTVDDICKKSNVSKGAFYTHFSSKQDIIITESKKTDSFHQKFFNSLSPSMSSHEKLIEFVRFHAQHIIDKGIDMERIIYTAEISTKTHPGYITDSNRPLYTCLNMIVEEGQKRGEFSISRTPTEVTNLLISSMRGAIFEWIVFEGDYDLIEKSLSLIDLSLEGLKYNSLGK